MPTIRVCSECGKETWDYFCWRGGACPWPDDEMAILCKPYCFEYTVALERKQW